MITIIIIAISLSMDAFSLALIYGTQGIVNKDKILLSTIVGIYHFLMPIIGIIFGKIIINTFAINTNIVVGIILLVIAIEMIIESLKTNKEKILLNFSGYLLFGLSVSIDSLTTGIGLPAITEHYILSSLVFSVVSFIFTFLGLNLGNILNIKYGKISTIIGGIILLIIGIAYILR